MSVSYLQGAMVFLRYISCDTRSIETAREAADLLQCRCANNSAATLCIQQLKILRKQGCARQYAVVDEIKINT